jgi:pimeloyl-ACP methyl ester carboxylesterase
MKVIIVPGFWLGPWSWDRITPALEAAGHDVVVMTLPGLESVDADRSGIGLAEHVAAVVELIDAAGERVVLVGHSGGGAIVHAAVDRRPDRVVRAIYVDSGPLPHGQAINPHLPVDGDDLPLPPWDVFREDGSRDLDDFTDDQLDDVRARAVPHPAAGARDPQELSDDPARYDVPITIVTTTFTRDEVEAYAAAGEAYFAEVPRIADVTIVELMTSHWPQLTQPERLAGILVDAIGRSATGTGAPR